MKVLTEYKLLGNVVAIMNEKKELSVIDPTLLLRTDFTVITVDKGCDNFGITIIKHIRDYLKKTKHVNTGQIVRPKHVEKDFIREDLLSNEFL